MKTRALAFTALFAALTAAGAFVSIPVGPVSITLQFLFTAMAGILLGRRCGALSQLVYVALGLLGLPIFTRGGGLGYVLQAEKPLDLVVVFLGVNDLKFTDAVKLQLDGRSAAV